jgi:hypothetical protein
MPLPDPASPLDALNRLTDAGPLPAPFARAVTRRRWARRTRTAAVGTLVVSAFALSTHLFSRSSTPAAPALDIPIAAVPAPTLASLSRSGLPDDPPTQKVPLPRPVRTESILRVFDVARVLREP